MADRRILAVGAAVVVVVVAVVVFLVWRAPSARRQGAPRPTVIVPDSIPVDNVTVVSPDLAIELVAMRGTVHPEYTDWACILECRERDGCRADVEVAVEYRSGGERRKLLIGGKLDAAEGEIMRVGRVQRPPVAVDGIDTVSMRVLEIHRAGAPRPTEIE
jgi:hypothetical protein